MSDAYIQTVSERYIELYENITGLRFEKADLSNIEERMRHNLAAYF